MVCGDQSQASRLPYIFDDAHHEVVGALCELLRLLRVDLFVDRIQLEVLAPASEYFDECFEREVPVVIPDKRGASR